MVRRSSTSFRSREANRRGDDDTSIAISRVSLDAPGRTAKEMLLSDSRGRKIYLEHHQNGTLERHRSRAPSIEERNPIRTSSIRDHDGSSRVANPPKSTSRGRSAQSPRKVSTRESTPETHGRRNRTALSSPRQGPPKEEKSNKSDRLRSKSVTRKQERSKSSPPKNSKREPLLTPENDIKQSSTNKNRLSKRIRSLKLRILDDEDDQAVPLYQPPVIQDHDSGDEAGSSGCDKYSVTATPGDSVRIAKSQKPKYSSDIHIRNSDMEATNGIAESAETLIKDKLPTASPQPDNSEPGWIAPVERPFRNIDSLHDEIDSVWSKSSNLEHQNALSKVLAKEYAIAAPTGIEEAWSDDHNHQSPLTPSKNADGILNSPRKASAHTGAIKSRLSSRDMDSVGYINTNSEELWSASEDGIIILKQRVAYCCIVVSAIQLGLLIIQLCLCGLASLSINPMIGPFPDAFSEWGGKNAFLMLEGKQYFRIVTPIFLHVGVIHLLINAYCQLETCAYFEREWGSARWITIYVISGMGSVLASSAIEPDLIGVCSSGALMGMFGAKIAQVVTWSIFVLKSSLLEESARFDHLAGVLCSAAMVSLLSFFTYIDWSGHLGGFSTGFLVGMTLFAKPIASRTSQAIWGSIGVLGMVIGSSILVRILSSTELDEELGDACQYFRSLYPDGYTCECVWE
ncbi:rhomboid family protein [Nitzschia inconspicua]|uniref:rhomboid protease n=1 Tax=Nitzschia inconspicua TaxID=303405 RepID=A0A9K3KID5_9STRA|nr:rhomboid family protein [Nitzschia inconspicua]